MPNVSTPAERAARFHTLVEAQGMYVRAFAEIPSVREDDEAKAKSEARLRELWDLAELLNKSQSADYDPDEAIRKWVAAHPLRATSETLRRRLDAIPSQPDTEVQVPLNVIVGDVRGDGNSPRMYQVNAPDVVLTQYGLHVHLPESVAEEFRQQGRRQLRREIHQALGI